MSRAVLKNKIYIYKKNDWHGRLQKSGHCETKRHIAQVISLLQVVYNRYESRSRINFVELTSSVPRSSAAGLASTFKIFFRILRCINSHVNKIRF